MQISAYIPCHNNAGTIRQAIESIQSQTVAVSELFVIDDASGDDSKLIAEQMMIPVIRLEENLGRGAVRALAMESSRHELVLCLDASKSLGKEFVEGALGWFEKREVAAVFGRIIQSDSHNAIDRWRGRHLFKMSCDLTASHRASLITAAALLRKTIAIEAGNYDRTLRYAEDRDLGERLLALGFDVVFDPELKVTALEHNDLWQVMERYWRWHAGVDQRCDWGLYFKQIFYSMKSMAHQDIVAGDPASIPISLLAPHYQFWRSWWQKVRGQ